MGVNYFTDEQVKILKENPNVKNVSNKAITYTDQFKEHFVNEYNKGKLPIVIFEDWNGYNKVVDTKIRE